MLDAQSKLKISQSELSRRLGKGRNYLSNAQNGCSTAQQLEIIDMINRVVAGEVFKSDDAIIAELSEKLANAQDSIHSLKKESDGYFIMTKDLSNEIERLTQKYTESMMRCGKSIEAKRILLNQSEEETLYWVSKVPSTRWAAFKLFIKLLITGKN